MSRRRISKSAGWVNPAKLPRGPDGRAKCRVCGVEVPRGRRSFCSDECVHQHKLRTQPAYVRKCLFERDRGVCCLCGTDTVVLEQHLALKINEARRGTTDAFKVAVQEFRRRLGRPLGTRRYGGYWDADHIKPVVLGGGECGLDNYRTLCILCHKKETAKLRKKIAKRKQNV